MSTGTAVQLLAETKHELQSVIAQAAGITQVTQEWQMRLIDRKVLFEELIRQLEFFIREEAATR